MTPGCQALPTRARCGDDSEGKSRCVVAEPSVGDGCLSGHLRGTARERLKKKEAARERFISLSHAPHDHLLSVAIFEK